MSPTKQKPSGVAKLQDRRVRRTRGDIDQAFLELLQRRSYDGIRVSDITRKANVGRATFYAHYRGKDELLRAQLTSLLQNRIQIKPNEPGLVDATALFEHLVAAPRLYRALMLGPSGPVVSRISLDILEDWLRPVVTIGLQRTRASAAVPIPVIVRFAAASLQTLVAWWVENGLNQSPRDLQTAYRALVGSGLSALVGGGTTG